MVPWVALNCLDVIGNLSGVGVGVGVGVVLSLDEFFVCCKQLAIHCGVDVQHPVAKAVCNPDTCSFASCCTLKIRQRVGITAFEQLCMSPLQCVGCDHSTLHQSASSCECVGMEPYAAEPIISQLCVLRCKSTYGHLLVGQFVIHTVI